MSKVRFSARKTPKVEEKSNVKNIKKRVLKVSISTSTKAKSSSRTSGRNTGSAESTPELRRGRSSAGRTPKRRSSKKKILTEDPIDENVSSTETTSPKVSVETSSNVPTDADVQTPPYVSPFVTLSRGKGSARRENAHRKSHGESTGILAGSQYFYKLLACEIERIQGVCQQWEQYREAENLSEEACNMINVPIGQSQLLINKKMSQFRQLIDKCILDSETEEFKVTCTDLHGFWDTIMIQVDNVNKRFAYLDSLRDNNWTEILPPAKPENTQEHVLQEKTKKRVLPARNAKQTASKIRDAIRAARRKHLQATDIKEFHGGFFNITSPIKEQFAPGSTKKETTLLRSVLENKSLMSPGLEMMNATMIAKRNETRTSLVTVSTTTPTKSILKLATPKSTAKKSVIFKSVPDIKVVCHYDDENDLNVENLRGASENGEVYESFVKETSPISSRTLRSSLKIDAL